LFIYIPAAPSKIKKVLGRFHCVAFKRFYHYKCHKEIEMGSHAKLFRNANKARYPPPTQSRINERASLQYWAFRVDRRYLTDLGGELQHGRLRQGWGWDNGQDLRDMKIDSGAGRNRRMFLEVKKWDRILIPHLPQYGQITYRRGDRRLGSGLQLLNLAEVRRPRPHIPGENPTQFPPHQFEYSRLD
jgi:hypothetical protein